MSGSVPETEDLYCDDELHPSLENDPNMQVNATLCRNCILENIRHEIYAKIGAMATVYRKL